MAKESIEETLLAKASQCTSFQELKMVTGVGTKVMEEVFAKNRLVKVRIQALFKKEPVNQSNLIPDEGIILDCSTVNAKNFVEALHYYVNAGYQFILTTISIKEFGRMQRISKRTNDFEILQSGRNARELMRLAVEREDVFLSIKIPERNINPDEDILDAIMGKPNLQLWTADKEMVLLARAQNINVVYVKEQIPIPKQVEMGNITSTDNASNVQEPIQEKANIVSTDVEEKKENSKAENSRRFEQEDRMNETVYGLRSENGQLYIGYPNPVTTYIEVYNRNLCSKDIKSALEVGDIILRLRVKGDGTAKFLSEERITSLSTRNNGCLKFNLKIWLDEENDISVPAKYAKFYKRALNTLRENQEKESRKIGC